MPIVNERAVAAGGVLLSVPAQPWTPGDDKGPLVVDLGQLMGEIERLAETK